MIITPTTSVPSPCSSETNSSYSVGMAIFGVLSGFEDNNLADICERSKYALQRTNSWAVDVSAHTLSVYIMNLYNFNLMGSLVGCH